MRRRGVFIDYLPLKGRRESWGICECPNYYLHKLLKSEWSCKLQQPGFLVYNRHERLHMYDA
jgi:hypothetical protein